MVDSHPSILLESSALIVIMTLFPIGSHKRGEGLHRTELLPVMKKGLPRLSPRRHDDQASSSAVEGEAAIPSAVDVAADTDLGLMPTQSVNDWTILKIRLRPRRLVANAGRSSLYPTNHWPYQPKRHKAMGQTADGAGKTPPHRLIAAVQRAEGIPMDGQNPFPAQLKKVMIPEHLNSGQMGQAGTGRKVPVAPDHLHANPALDGLP
jgi:hypothetical protein